jgi:hypothetical protein
MATNLDPEDAKAGLRAVEGYPFDQPRQGFAVLVAVGGFFADAHDGSMFETG